MRLSILIIVTQFILKEQEKLYNKSTNYKLSAISKRLKPIEFVSVMKSRNMTSIAQSDLIELINCYCWN